MVCCSFDIYKLNINYLVIDKKIHQFVYFLLALRDAPDTQR